MGLGRVASDRGDGFWCPDGRSPPAVRTATTSLPVGRGIAGVARTVSESASDRWSPVAFRRNSGRHADDPAWGGSRGTAAWPGGSESVAKAHAGRFTCRQSQFREIGKVAGDTGSHFEAFA